MPATAAARRDAPDCWPRPGPDRPPLLSRSQYVVGPPAGYARPGSLHLPDPLAGLVGPALVRVAARLPSPARLRPQHRRAAGAGQGQPPGPDGNDDPPRPRYPGPLRRARGGDRLGAAASAVRATASAG